MNPSSRHRVVEHLAAKLAERRRVALARRTAYLTLAWAIARQEPTDQLWLEQQPTRVGDFSAA